MFSVIFEVLPKEERFNDYLDLAKHLKPMLEHIDGFVDNERFESKRRNGWLLSHSTWRDEKSVVRWRTQSDHHSVQERGRFEVFADYHLRVGDVVADTHPPDNAPIREQRYDETETGTAHWATLTEFLPAQGTSLPEQVELLLAQVGLDTDNKDLVEYDVFSSINTKGKLALLTSWRTRDGASHWQPHTKLPLASQRHRLVRIVRDYGMFDRREAPQYYPDVSKFGTTPGT